jgi:hypothetical protein
VIPPVWFDLVRSAQARNGDHASVQPRSGLPHSGLGGRFASFGRGYWTSPLWGVVSSPAMSTEVWLRNPHDYIREVVEVRHHLIAWDRGVLVKKAIDPNRFADLYFDSTVDYRMLAIGGQGAAELQRGRTMRNPAAVYPVWEYSEDLATLMEFIENPPGEDVDACEDPRFEPDERPVLGQEHRVVITEMPPVNTGPGRRVIRLLSELQEDYPDVILHLHGLYSYRTMFGQNFRAADVDARTAAQKGKVMLPMGKEVKYERAVEFPQWVSLCNMLPVDLKIPRNRCMYNIKSALWAAENFNRNYKFRSNGKVPIDPDQPSSQVQPATVKSYATSPAKEDGDKFLCDTCSIADSCKYYREGAVCSVPGTEPAKFASMFRTRDSDQIIDALGSLLETQANRLERGIEDEEFGEEMDPEVSKMINSLFANGVKLAKLVNPSLSGGSKVGVFVNGGQGSSVAVGTSAQQLTASIVAELEEQGVPRDQITPEMIGQVINGEKPAIEAKAVEHREAG